MTALLALLCVLAQASRPIADGVVDADGTNLYLPSKEGGIDGLDAVTGRLRFHYDASGKPLAVAGGKLVIETVDPNKAHVVRFRVLSVPEGKVVLDSKPLELPDWVARGVRGKFFTADARIEKGTLVYEWQAAARYAGGVPLTKAFEDQHRKNAAGTARINLETGEVVNEPAVREWNSETPIDSVTNKGRIYRVVEDRSKVDPVRGGEVTRTLKVKSTFYGETPWEWPLPSRHEKPLPQ